VSIPSPLILLYNIFLQYSLSRVKIKRKEAGEGGTMKKRTRQVRVLLAVVIVGFVSFMVLNRFADKTEERYKIEAQRYTSADTAAEELNNVLEKYRYKSLVLKYDGTDNFTKATWTVIVYIENEKMAVEKFWENGKGRKISLYDGKDAYLISGSAIPGEDNVAIKTKKGKINRKYFPAEPKNIFFIKKEKFLGRMCKVYKIKFPSGFGSTTETYYFWNGIMLKRIDDIMGPDNKSWRHVLEATDVKIDVEIPPGKFVLPKGCKIRSLKEHVELSIKKAKAAQPL